MKRHELIIIGAGPAGLSAAIEAKKNGMDVIVFDENARPGGQLFKQIHKFFGSKEHHAKERGFRIGEALLKEATDLGVRVELNATVMGIYENKEVTVKMDGSVHHYKGDYIIIATGAAENMIPFKGWDTPGVIGAGAAQALMNLQGVQPGQKVLMVGSGNVGLVVSFQLLQAGCEVAAVIDAAPRVGGYGVHAAKVARTGVPFYLSHTVIEAKGGDRVKSAVIAQVDEHFKPIPGTEKELDVDTICIAVGLTPMSQLASNATCKMELLPSKGGNVALCDEHGETSVKGIYCAGDVAGIEEASSAMIQGKNVASHICMKAGYIDEDEFNTKYHGFQAALGELRQGMFAPKNKGRNDWKTTDEGYPISRNLLAKGFVTDEEMKFFPAAKTDVEGIHPVIECTQNIPCNPCQEACKFGCIMVGANITRIPVLNEKKKCIGCGMCVATCSGQAIFLVHKEFEPGYTSIGFPYEFLPMLKTGDKGKGLDRSGKPVCDAEIIDVKTLPAMDKTAVVTMKVPTEYADTARFFKLA
ncbi:FAD-dependent oxidoreductase [Treponema sp.]|uniref:FAD-dependent oxidoreductase n=1 Tax=Treponema sp. TaxID=166 RepID=UPI0025DD1B01|nr:FAD-dependent oxidoreductase [Treponema sp.]MCR5217554.1 FAD-dependent oxidoreductase [Treponema sp.]